MGGGREGRRIERRRARKGESRRMKTNQDIRRRTLIFAPLPSSALSPSLPPYHKCLGLDDKRKALIGAHLGVENLLCTGLREQGRERGREGGRENRSMRIREVRMNSVRFQSL